MIIFAITEAAKVDKLRLPLNDSHKRRAHDALPIHVVLHPLIRIASDRPSFIVRDVTMC